MTISRRLVGLLTIMAGVIPAGCDVGDSSDELALGSDLQFREGDPTGPPKTNTNFLGATEDYPLENLPLQPGGEEGVQILEIRGNKCRDVTGATIFGQVSTLPVSSDVNVTVSSDGVLQPITVALVTNPAIECQIWGNHWEGTHWEILAQYGEAPEQETVETDLKLVDASLDSFGSTAYRWHVNDDRVLDEASGTYVPTCDEDPDPVTPGLGFHAYLIPDLRIDATTAEFSYAAADTTVFMACASSAPGKGVNFGYAPWDHDSDTHELATRMVRADYNGDGLSHTLPNTPIWLQDNLNVWPTAAPADYATEAGWSVAEGKAICLSQPRRPQLVTAGGSLPPSCTQQLLNGADIITSVPMP